MPLSLMESISRPALCLLADLAAGVEPAEVVDEKLEHMKKISTELGISEDIDAFMTLAFISLPVIPQTEAEYIWNCGCGEASGGKSQV